MTTAGKRVLFAGGSFGGLASMKYFIKQFLETKATTNIELFLLEPRAGFINVLGIPLAIVSPKFAAESYLNVEGFNFKFSKVESNDAILTEKILNAKPNQEFPDNLKLTYIQGKCVSFIDNHNINYQLTDGEDIRQLSFDYCVFSTGRKRAWPFDPLGYTQEQFVKEMGDTQEKIEKAKTISVIGAGALGIEIAGELKEEYPDKKIILIHPHPFIPPETYAAKSFKEGTEKQVRSLGIDLQLNTRIAKEEDNGDLLTTKGDIIKSELNFWCNFHTNNIQSLLPYFQDSVVDKKGEVIVDERMLIKGSTNVFAIGDIINLPIIKTAGGAYRQGEVASGTIFNILVKGEEKYEQIDLKTWPHAMTVVVGRGKSITQYNADGDGEVQLDNQEVLDFYQDYCNTRTRTLMNLD